MTSVTDIFANRIPVELPAATMKARLVLGTAEAGKTPLDGAWWPHSTDLSVEIPALLVAVAERLGAVNRLALRMDDWSDMPRRLSTVMGIVRLEWFRGWTPHTVRLVASDRQLLDLYVVPPATSHAIAAAALTMAAEGRTAEDITVAVVTETIPEPRHPREDRWENEGGHLVAIAEASAARRPPARLTRPRNSKPTE